MPPKSTMHVISNFGIWDRTLGATITRCTLRCGAPAGGTRGELKGCKRHILVDTLAYVSLLGGLTSAAVRRFAVLRPSHALPSIADGASALTFRAAVAGGRHASSNGSLR